MKSALLEFDTHTVLSRDEVLISLIILLQVLLSSWRSARKVQLCFLRDLVFHLQNCRIQQKLHETHKICLWLERIRSSHKEFAYLLYNSTENTWNSQNLASWWTKLLLCSLQLEIAIFPGGVRKFWKFRRGGGGGVKFGSRFWKIKRGGGHTANPFRGGGMDIFWNHTISLCVRTKYFAPSVEQKRDLD